MKPQHSVAMHTAEQEHKQLKSDLIVTILLNGLFVAVLIALFAFNQQTGGVDEFFQKLLKF